MPSLNDLIAALPKAELHIHIEGSLEPDHLFDLAKRNGIAIPYATVDDIKAAYNFSNLQSFLDVYYLGTKVLVTEEDFAELLFRYMTRAHQDNVKHAEIMFDPQSHTSRGIKFETVLNGLEKGMARAKLAYGITSMLIMSFLRHLSEDDAFSTLEEALPFIRRIGAVGLDSGEQGNPPEKFRRVFAKCAELGLRRVAHAGEEGPPENIRDAISMLQVCRIDHGVACTKDASLVDELVKSQMPLTVCPRSNVALCVFSDYTKANTIEMLRRGIAVTINSDDPAYFGGYLNANYSVLSAVGVTNAELAQLAKNSFVGSWLPDEAKASYCQLIDDVLQSMTPSNP